MSDAYLAYLAAHLEEIDRQEVALTENFLRLERQLDELKNTRQSVEMARNMYEAWREGKPCTCHPDDRPPVCQKRYAAGECIAAWQAALPPIVEMGAERNREPDIELPAFLDRRVTT